MPFVHSCVYCGDHEPAASATMLAPNCRRCGCALRACHDRDFLRIAAALVGIDLRDMAFAVPGSSAPSSSAVRSRWRRCVAAGGDVNLA